MLYFPYQQVGDHIEKIDSTSLVNRRHFEVAQILKQIPVGATFTVRLVEPLKAGFGKGVFIGFLLAMANYVYRAENVQINPFEEKWFR